MKEPGEKEFKNLADLIAGVKSDGVQSNFRIDRPQVRMPKRKSTKPLTADVNHYSEPAGEFGCYRTLPKRYD